MPVIEAARLGKVFRGGRGVFDLDFQVEEGEIFGFLGPNAAGKTTTIRTLLGFLRPTSGSARVFGLDVWRQAPAVKARVGFVPGEPHLYEKLTGRQHLEFLAGFRAPGARERGRAMARDFDLDLSQRIKHLSKGNRQKLVLIGAFMHDPPLYLLDEPTSGLDPVMQAQVLELLKRERSRGKTVFLSSHYLPEVEKTADRVAIVKDGRLVALEAVEVLQMRRRRRMEVIAKTALVPDRFAGVPGVAFVASHEGGRHIELDVTGDVRPLLARLATLPVTDVVYPPADLESVFLEYYGSPAHSEARSA